MAESHEENSRLLIGALLELHMELRDILLNLPIPLTIPSTADISEIRLLAVMRSVHRAAELVADEPIPEGLTAVLIDVLNLWNAAAIATATAQDNEGEPFYSAAGVALGHVDSGVRFLAELLEMLPGTEE